jgi:23S rRNA pseudouridine2605 synthase
MRIAKALARAGLCSRREAERWIEEGRVSVNGETLKSPARDVSPRDKVVVDGNPLPSPEPPRLWRYHKPKGLVTTHRDPQGRPTVFDSLPPEVPRVISIGRLDFNTEGLLLLTNDGALARHLELPATGWLRRYRVRAHGSVTQEALDQLKDGIEIAGIRYGPIEAILEKPQGTNVWLVIGLREGKNREVRTILEHLGLTVNRLIRVSFGPFQLFDLAPGAVDAVKPRVLSEQLGHRMAAELGLDRVDADVATLRRAHGAATPRPDKDGGRKDGARDAGKDTRRDARTDARTDSGRQAQNPGGSANSRFAARLKARAENRAGPRSQDRPSERPAKGAPEKPQGRLQQRSRHRSKHPPKSRS